MAESSGRHPSETSDDEVRSIIAQCEAMIEHLHNTGSPPPGALMSRFMAARSAWQEGRTHVADPQRDERDDRRGQQGDTLTGGAAGEGGSDGSG